VPPNKDPSKSARNASSHPIIGIEAIVKTPPVIGEYAKNSC